MSFTVRDGEFDVAVVAGPLVSQWPSPGAAMISSMCAGAGLRVGLFGEDSISARGVIPLAGSGGLVLAVDSQQRIHRIRARAVVRVSALAFLPDPFKGWRAPCLLPVRTAELLWSDSLVSWDAGVAILGTGNRAFRFGAALLDAGIKSVTCIEPFADWGAKRFAGWEVERRRFEVAGGIMLEAVPVEIRKKGPMLWRFVVNEGPKEKTLDVAWIVSAGPFRDSPGIREYPPGSMLFEIEQTAVENREHDLEGWELERERGRYLASKIIKSLSEKYDREAIDRAHKLSRTRLKRFVRHRAEPFTPAYDGKWIAAADSKKLRSAAGVPQKAQRLRVVASVECFESIACDLCAAACQKGTIKFSGSKGRSHNETVCSGCGYCVSACPAGAIVLMKEIEGAPFAQVTFPWRGQRPWQTGEQAGLVNRRGEALGSGRISNVTPSGAPVQLVQVEVPAHLAWDARGLRRLKTDAAADDAFIKAETAVPVQKVEIMLNGEKRLVREGIVVSVALLETGLGRAEDTLLCPDGSCNLCTVVVDGVNKLACRTLVHKGMSIKLPESPDPEVVRDKPDAPLCSCMGITFGQVSERISQGDLKSPGAVRGAVHACEGKCHGITCGEAFRRALVTSGLDAAGWIDWRFPWQEWKLTK
ncbi:MAG: hypothetical protein A2583_11050 [Bdellovibrionales bacterium RIFOXYD1_FULL_53_11]|nr:MAG: hypothetical protein A2583_11050 [Bdellovibrionales bacterium RIFOXYD1_FULL_53_11]